MATLQFETPATRAGWLLYADPALAPIRRSRSGSNMPVSHWLLHADHGLAPIWRSVTVEESAATTNPIVGRNLACIGSRTATVAQLAASVGVAPTRLAKTLDRMTSGTVATRKTSGGRVRRVVVGDRSEEIKDALASTLSCRAAGRRLGISAKRVAVLRRTGLLVPITEAGCQRFLTTIPDAKVDRPQETVALSEALRRLVKVDRTAALVRSLLDQTLRCWCDAITGSRPHSLAHLHVCRDGIEAWALAALEDGRVSVISTRQAWGVPSGPWVRISIQQRPAYGSTPQKDASLVAGVGRDGVAGASERFRPR